LAKPRFLVDWGADGRPVAITGTKMNAESNTARGYSVEALGDFYRNSPFDFGAGDIFSFGPAKTLEVVADLVFILSTVQDQNGKNPISQFTVILPPRGEYTDDDVRAAFSDAVARHRGRPLDARELEILPRRLNAVVVADLEARTAVALIEAARRNSVVVICDGARYRKEALQSAPPDGRRIAPQEDTWVPQFHALAVDAIAAAKRNDLYVALDTGRWRPRRKANLDLLMSVEDCALMTAENENDPDGVLAEHADKWGAEIEAGRIGAVLNAIDALPETRGRWRRYAARPQRHRAR
jgi:hypothetical protein